MKEKDYPHLFVKNIHTVQQFKTTPRPGGRSLPEKDRVQHGNFLLKDLNSIWEKFSKEESIRIQNGLPVKNGEYITFKSSENNTLKIKSLDSEGAKLLNVKHNSKTKQDLATVFIPKDKKSKLISKIEKYLSDTLVSGKPKNLELVNRIQEIEKSAINHIWTSPKEYLPAKDRIWCEIWINGGEELFDEVKVDFVKICDFFNIEIGQTHINFPERSILTIKANYSQLIELIKSFGYIAELRKLEELNSFWLDDNDTIENNEWINDSLEKITFKKTNNVISILDTGINNGHRLLAPMLNDNDKLTVNQIWGKNDIAEPSFIGHGSSMAGLSAYGDLKHILKQTSSIIINHKLESIKIIPNKGYNKKESYPNITEQALSIAKISSSKYKRIFCLAVTADYQVEFGKPSSWSSAIDKAIFGDDLNDKKIFVISTGNVRFSDDYTQYPETNLNCIIESPAQAWNAITIGAYTTKTLIKNKTVANKKELSPFSRTSSSFERNWPIKPEVVFEGGNLRLSDNGVVENDIELDLLTTSHKPLRNLYTTIHATSAATALAANFLAKLRNVYPDAWEETLRALIIHSSSWTNEMKKQFNFDGKSLSALNLLRIVGYGVPNIQKAISCKTNYLTFIAEEIIQPYKKEKSKEPETYEVHYYDFPWPKEILESIENTEVTLKVTLSYFIEPNPGERGNENKYSYQSAALKFALINPGETLSNFKLRTNKFNRDRLAKDLKKENLDSTDFNKNTGNSRWVLGAENVFRGSVHSNYWVGPAIEIADCNRIAIFPQSSGWWKNLKSKEKYNEKLKYSLIVSLETPENSADIYTEIVNKVKVENLVKV
jgi:hypothetical protein